MKKLFLASSFSDVANLFEDFAKTNIKGKKVTFIPTASIPEEVKFYVDADRDALEKLGMIIDVLEISTTTSDEISEKLRHNDFIFISGGNTFFLLQELKRTGADRIIIEQIEAGKIYIGVSAGSVVMSPDIEYIKDMDDVAKAPYLKSYSALNVVNFYPLPHYTNYPFTEAVEKIISEYNSRLKLYPISNSQVISAKGDNVEIKHS